MRLDSFSCPVGAGGSGLVFDEVPSLESILWCCLPSWYIKCFMASREPGSDLDQGQPPRIIFLCYSAGDNKPLPACSQVLPIHATSCYILCFAIRVLLGGLGSVFAIPRIRQAHPQCSHSLHCSATLLLCMLHAYSISPRFLGKRTQRGASKDKCQQSVVLYLSYSAQKAGETSRTICQICAAVLMLVALCKSILLSVLLVL